MTEALHLLQNLVDVWHHVLSIDHDGSVGAVPQSHVEHSAALNQGIKDYSGVAFTAFSVHLKRMCRFSCVTRCKTAVSGSFSQHQVKCQEVNTATSQVTGQQ